jgi:hypothetical protein
MPDGMVEDPLSDSACRAFGARFPVIHIYAFSFIFVRKEQFFAGAQIEMFDRFAVDQPRSVSPISTSPCVKAGF